jgi:hypothetical protein
LINIYFHSSKKKNIFRETINRLNIMKIYLKEKFKIFYNFKLNLNLIIKNQIHFCVFWGKIFFFIIIISLKIYIKNL